MPPPQAPAPKSSGRTPVTLGKGPAGIEKCKLPCAEAKLRMKCAFALLLLAFVLLVYCTRNWALWWWSAAAACVCMYIALP